MVFVIIMQMKLNKIISNQKEKSHIYQKEIKSNVDEVIIIFICGFFGHILLDTVDL